MLSNRIAGMAATILVLAAGAGTLTADEKNHDITDALGAKLGLSDQQKDEIRKICADTESKKEAVEFQLWTAHREARAELKKMLTDDQRAKLPEVIKEERNQELQPIASKLGLTDEQQAHIGKSLMQFKQKFQELATESPDAARKQFGELKQQVFAAVCKDLNDDQRIKLTQVMRSEFHKWTNQQFQNEHVKAIENKLSLSSDQKSQVEKLISDCEQKIEKPVAQIKQLCQEESAAIEKVLTDEQRTKFQELMKSTMRNQ